MLNLNAFLSFSKLKTHFMRVIVHISQQAGINFQQDTLNFHLKELPAHENELIMLKGIVKMLRN